MVASQLTASAVQALQGGSLAGTWILDSAKSEVKLRSKSMWGMVSVKGVFSQVSGRSVVTQGGEVTGTIIVGAASIDTKSKKRDEHLRSADFFDVAKYPDFTFEISGVTPADDGVTVTGSLTVVGKTKPLSFSANVSSFNGDELWLDADVQVNRGDFGLTWNQMGMASMDNTLSVHAGFTRG